MKNGMDSYMTDGLTLGGNEIVSGEVVSETLVGQAASAVEIAAPAAGKTTNVVLTKGQTATLNFDATAATPVLEGNDFVLTFDSNGDGSADSRIVFQNLVEESQGADAPVLVIGGVELSAGLLIGQAQALVDGQTLETAAGAGTGPQGGGGSTYDDDFGEVIDGLTAQGSLISSLADLVAAIDPGLGDTLFDDAPVAVDDVVSVLDEASENIVSGNLLANGDTFGNDGPGVIRSISQDGVSYELAADGQSVSNLGKGDNFDPSTGILTIITDAGATLTVDMSGAGMGEFSYEGPANHSGEDFALGGGTFDGDTYTQTNPATGVTVTVTAEGTRNGDEEKVVVVSVVDAVNNVDGLGVNNIFQGNGDTNYTDNGGVQESLTFSFSDTDGVVSTDYFSFNTQDNGPAISWSAETTSGTVTGTSVAGESPVVIEADGIISVTLSSADPDQGFAVSDVSTAVDTMQEVFVYTLEDADGDQDSATLTVAVADDNPTAVIALKDGAEFVLDETDNDSDDGDIGGLLASVTLGFDELFVDSSSFGVDGAAAANSATYSLILNGTQPVSLGITQVSFEFGLFDTQTGEVLTATQDASGDIVASSETGGEVFRVSLDANGETVTVTQSRAVRHDNPTGQDNPLEHNELNNMDFFNVTGIIQLNATVTDADGDQSDESIDLGSIISFKDDGPSAVDDVAEVFAVEGGGIVTGNVITDGAGKDDAGSDGAEITAVNGITLNLTGETEIRGAKGSLFISRDGSYRYEGIGDADVGIDEFDYTLTDGDGDTDTATLSINTREAINAVDDLILTNITQGTIETPDWALLRNDTAENTADIGVDGASNAVGGTVSHDGTEKTVSFTIAEAPAVIDQVPAVPEGGSFDYSASDANTSNTAAVDIRIEDTNRLTGTSASEIIIGDNVENEISGDFASGEGDVTGLVAQGAGDAIIGNNQDDHLVGDFAVYRQEDDDPDGDFTSRSDLINSSVVGGDDRIQAGEGNDILVGDLYVDDDFGGDDDDELSPTSLTGGDDYLDGGAGNDEISGDAFIGDDIEGGSVIFTEDGPIEGRPGDAHILIGGADTILGGSGEDVLVGDLNIYDNVEDGAHTLTGGNDNLDGGSDNDVLIGDFKIGHTKGEEADPNQTLDVYGSDSILTGGDDVLNGGEGDDTLTGDFSVFASVEDDSVFVSGSDTFVFSLAEGGEEGDGHDTITDFESAKDILHFTDVVDSDGDGLDLDDLTAAISGVIDGGEGGNVVVSFDNGASITFEGLGTGAITSIDELVNDPANQIVID